jgi:hypothetical protein
MSRGYWFRGLRPCCWTGGRQNQHGYSPGGSRWVTEDVMRWAGPPWGFDLPGLWPGAEGA